MLGRPYHLDPGLNHGIPDEFQALGYPILSIRSIPKDPSGWRGSSRTTSIAASSRRRSTSATCGRRTTRPTACRRCGRPSSPRVIPNVVVLDLSSFKCGHDAPTYGLIDNIITASGTPYSALHDIDANKPGGSIKIRVKTYAHTLKRFEEELADRRRSGPSSSTASTDKRRELHPRAARPLRERRSPMHAARQELDEIDAAFTSYLEEDTAIDEHREGAEPDRRDIAPPAAGRDGHGVPSTRCHTEARP